MIGILFPNLNKNLSPEIQKRLTKDFKSSDKIMLIISIINFIVISSITSIKYDTYILGFISGAILLFFSILAYIYFKGTIISRVLFGMIFMIYPAIMTTQQMGLIEMHFVFFLLVAALTRYKDITAILSATIVVSVYHLYFTYLQLENITFNEYIIMIYNHGCSWDIAFLHICLFSIEAVILILFVVSGVKQFIDVNKLQIKSENSLIKLKKVNKNNKGIIKETIKVANGVSNGDLKQRVNTDTTDENIKELKEIINIMMDNLEKEVEIRTAELTRTNEELEDSNEELQTTIHNLKTTQDKLIESEKMASLGGLVAGVAHEINTPVGIGLTGITHLSSLSKRLKKSYMKEDMSREEFEEYLKETNELTSLIEKNLERTSQLVKNFKQIAVDQTNEDKRDFNLKEYTEGILFSLDSIIKKKDVNILIYCDENLNIYSYPGLYSQILTNLIINSYNHGFDNKSEGNIIIDISKKDNKITLIYKDDGKGIKEKNLAQIFDPFFTTNRKAGGTGLGLNIIYNIVTSTLKGSIKCKSQENKGVEFILIFNT